MKQDIREYIEKLAVSDQEICYNLLKEIDVSLKNSESKIWHAHPVWFIDGNPIVGFSKLKDCIRLLFWSGQSFNEPELNPEGKFKAAEKRYTSVEQINVSDLRNWIKKAEVIQWDYKNLVRRKGVLERLL